MNARETTCPETVDLRAFAIGDLPGALFERVAAHVGRCGQCASALAAWDAASDGLVSSLRGLEERTDCPAEDVPPPLLAAAKAALHQLVVDHGRHIARAIEDGPLRLGKFLLEEKIGVGSFGYVFRARDTELDRIVALKVPRWGQLGSRDENDRFLREARSAAQFEHPNIVSLYETGETEDGTCYLVTELVEGVTLEEAMRNRPRSFEESARLIADVAMALQYAHTHGVVHRDVKPSNIMLDGDGRPHVMDFGLAKRDVGEVTVTPDGEVMGTPAYMSPELARGDSHHVDARSDVFSLGVILYELLTGERPFQGNRRMLILQVLEEEPRPPHRLNEKVPRDLETICLEAMAKNPARRYASAQELADDLLRFVRGEPIQARPVGRPERLWRWCRKNPLAVGFFVLVVLGSTFGFWYLSELSRELVRRSALESATQYADLLQLVNDLYSTEVVDRVGDHGVTAAADYASREGAIPLPATMMSLLLERIGDTDSGMRGRHYSEYPFRFRTDGGPRDAFERDALARLQEDPERAYWEFSQDRQRRPVLRYAKARIMQPSCVSCHNHHPDSTKRDWKVGDVRGVLEIIRPLASDAVRTEQKLRGSFVLVGVVAGMLLLVTASVLVLRRP